MLIKLNKEGTISLLNRKGYEILGYDKGELIGKNWFDTCVPKDILNEIKEVFNKLIRGEIEEVEHYENPILRKDGKIRVVSWYNTYLKNEQGDIIGILSSGEDITDRKKAEESLKNSEMKYRNIIENIKDEYIIFTTNKNAELTYLSPSIKQILGYSQEDFLGNNYLNYITNDEQRREEESYNVNYKKGISIPHHQTEFYHKDGIRKILLDIKETSVFDENGTFIGSQGVARDITEMKKKEDALRASEKKYRNYIDNAPDGVFVSDLQGNYLEVNNAASKITGYSKDELLNMNIRNITCPDYEQLAIDHFERLKDIGYSSAENCFIHKDGSKHWWNVDAVKISENRFLGFAKDITEMVHARDKIKEEQKKTDTILNAAADGIRIITKDMKIKAMNKTMSNMTNTPIEQAINMICSKQFKSKHCGTDECSMKKVLSTGEGFEEEDIRISQSGEQIPCLISVTPYRDDKGEIIGIIEDYRDITQLKQAEKELRKAHNELKELNISLEKKVEERTIEIQQLLKQKDEFIHLLSHDLKNPLSPMTMLLPVLEERINDEKTKDIIKRFSYNVYKIKNLINESLKLAQLNHVCTEMNIESMNLQEMIQNVIDDNELMLHQNNANINSIIDPMLSVFVEKFQIVELLNNLISNAVKYCPMDKMCQINIIAKPIENDKVEVSFSDNGIGLTPEQINNIFNEFYRGAKPRDGMDSTGLGLSLCKSIIEKHGGNIWVESEGIGQGSTFYITLPTTNTCGGLIE